MLIMAADRSRCCFGADRALSYSGDRETADICGFHQALEGLVTDFAQLDRHNPIKDRTLPKLETIPWVGFTGR